MENNELQHWGVKGMKWGIRRYQNKDGTLTAAGKKRYAQELEKLRKEEQVLKNRKKTQAQIDKLEAKRKKLAEERRALDEGEKTTKTKALTEKVKEKAVAKKPRKVKDMTDDELNAAIARLKLESDYMKAVSDRINAASARKYTTLKAEGKNNENIKKGKTFLESLKDDVMIPGLKEGGKQVVKNAVSDLGKKVLEKSAKDAAANQQQKKKN